MKKLFTIFMVLALTACAKPYSPSQSQPQTQSYWTKPDYTQAAFNSDRYQCLQSAIAQSQPNNALVVASVDSSMMQTINEGNLFNACMQAKGYVWQTVAVPHDPISDNLDLKAAYCLAINQGISRVISEKMEKNKNVDTLKLQQQSLDYTNDTAQKISQYLQIKGLYSPDPENRPPDVAAYINRGTQDIQEMYAHPETAFHQCTSKCSAKESFQCFQNCDPYKNDKERRMLSCGGIENQLATQ